MRSNRPSPRWTRRTPPVRAHPLLNGHRPGHDIPPMHGTEVGELARGREGPVECAGALDRRAGSTAVKRDRMRVASIPSPRDRTARPRTRIVEVVAYGYRVFSWRWVTWGWFRRRDVPAGHAIAVSTAPQIGAMTICRRALVIVDSLMRSMRDSSRRRQRTVITRCPPDPVCRARRISIRMSRSDRDAKLFRDSPVPTHPS